VAQGRGTGILEICTEWPGPWPEERRRTSAATVASSAKALLKNAEGKTWPVELEEIMVVCFCPLDGLKVCEGQLFRGG
jgi:hypothetical protein